MKQWLKKAIVLGSILPVSFFVSAQENTARPVNQWMETGYWVVESNIQSPKTNIIYIYNDNDSLIYKEKIEGMRINIKRKAIVKKLEKAVETSLLAWSASKNAKDKNTLVITILKHFD